MLSIPVRYGDGLTEVPLHSDSAHPTPPTHKPVDLLNMSILSTRSYQRIEEESDDEEGDIRSLDSYKAAIDNGEK